MRSEPEELKNEETKFELFEYSIYSSSVLGQVQEQGAIGRTKTLSFDANFVERLISEISVPIQLKKSEEFFSSSAYSVDLEGIFIPIVAVGEARCGKSTSLNIIIQHLVKPELLTPKESYFAVRKGKEPVTDGIHGCLIRYSDMKTDAQEMLNQIFGPENTQEKHVVLFDCEGTGVGDTAEINKLYTAALLISLKGVFMASTSKRIYKEFINTFFTNYDTLRTHLVRDENPGLNISVLIKDQVDEERDLSNDEKNQEKKRKDNFEKIEKGTVFLEDIKPMVYCLSDADRKERAAFDSGNYSDDNSPLVIDVIKCFWNSIQHFQNAFVTSNTTKWFSLKGHLEHTIEVLNGGFKNGVSVIKERILDHGISFKKEISTLLENIKPAEGQVTDTLLKIDEFFVKHKESLLKTLENLNENTERIQNCENIFNDCGQRILKELFDDYKMLRFMHYDYLVKMLNQSSIWKLTSKSIHEELRQYRRSLESDQVQKLRETCSFIDAIEKADQDVRKGIANELENFPNSHSVIPVKTLTKILNRQGSRNSGAQFDVLKFNIMKHILYLFILVISCYENHKNKNIVGLGLTTVGIATGGVGFAIGEVLKVILKRVMITLAGEVVAAITGAAIGDCMGNDNHFNFKIEKNRLKELKEVFKEEIKSKEIWILSSDDDRFGMHIQGLIKKTKEEYLKKLCS